METPPAHAVEIWEETLRQLGRNPNDFRASTEWRKAPLVFGPMAPVPSDAEQLRADALRERETARIEEYRRTGKFPNR